MNTHGQSETFSADMMGNRRPLRESGQGWWYDVCYLADGAILSRPHKLDRAVKRHEHWLAMKRAK